MSETENNDCDKKLIRAAQRGDSDECRSLIAAGAELDIRDNYGDTAISRAAANGHTEVVRILAEAGADLNNRDNSGRTALYYLC